MIIAENECNFQDAIKHKSFHETEGDMFINFGNVEKEFKNCDHIIEGEVK